MAAARAAPQFEYALGQWRVVDVPRHEATTASLLPPRKRGFARDGSPLPTPSHLPSDAPSDELLAMMAGGHTLPRFRSNAGALGAALSRPPTAQAFRESVAANVAPAGLAALRLAQRSLADATDTDSRTAAVARTPPRAVSGRAATAEAARHDGSSSADEQSTKEATALIDSALAAAAGAQGWHGVSAAARAAAERASLVGALARRLSELREAEAQLHSQVEYLIAISPAERIPTVADRAGLEHGARSYALEMSALRRELAATKARLALSLAAASHGGGNGSGSAGGGGHVVGGPGGGRGNLGMLALGPVVGREAGRVGPRPATAGHPQPPLPQPLRRGLVSGGGPGLSGLAAEGPMCSESARPATHGGARHGAQLAASLPSRSGGGVGAPRRTAAGEGGGGGGGNGGSGEWRAAHDIAAARAARVAQRRLERSAASVACVRALTAATNLEELGRAVRDTLPAAAGLSAAALFLAVGVRPDGSDGVVADSEEPMTTAATLNKPTGTRSWLSMPSLSGAPAGPLPAAADERGVSHGSAADGGGGGFAGGSPEDSVEAGVARALRALPTPPEIVAPPPAHGASALLTAAAIHEVEFQLGHGFTGRAFARRQPLLVHRPAHQETFHFALDARATHGRTPLALIACPLLLPPLGAPARDDAAEGAHGERQRCVGVLQLALLPPRPPPAALLATAAAASAGAQHAPAADEAPADALAAVEALAPVVALMACALAGVKLRVEASATFEPEATLRSSRGAARGGLAAPEGMAATVEGRALAAGQSPGDVERPRGGQQAAPTLDEVIGPSFDSSRRLSGRESETAGGAAAARDGQEQGGAAAPGVGGRAGMMRRVRLSLGAQSDSPDNSGAEGDGDEDAIADHERRVLLQASAAAAAAAAAEHAAGACGSSSMAAEALRRMNAPSFRQPHASLAQLASQRPGSAEPSRPAAAAAAGGAGGAGVGIDEGSGASARRSHRASLVCSPSPAASAAAAAKPPASGRRKRATFDGVRPSGIHEAERGQFLSREQAQTVCGGPPSIVTSSPSVDVTSSRFALQHESAEAARVQALERSVMSAMKSLILTHRTKPLHLLGHAARVLGAELGADRSQVRALLARCQLSDAACALTPPRAQPHSLVAGVAATRRDQAARAGRGRPPLLRRALGSATPHDRPDQQAGGAPHRRGHCCAQSAAGGGG